MANNLQDEAACTVCLEVFFSPITLSCTHTFCLYCMQSWMKEQEDLKLVCPMCRGVIENPPLKDWQIEELALLITQHSSRLEQGMHMSDEYLKFWEDITLDPATANSFLVFSEDLRSIQYGKIYQNLMEDPQRFDYWAGVLGTPCFVSGCHYWEVEVGEGNEWALGVCKMSVNRKRPSGFSSDHGFWIIRMKAGTIYTFSVLETRIPVSPGLCHVGIFLDIELEEIKFFDVSNDVLIYTHNNLSCLEPLCPFFSLELPREGEKGASLKICPSEMNPFIETSCEMNEVFDVRNEIHPFLETAC